MGKGKNLIFLLFAITFAVSSSLLGATIYVDDDAPSDPCHGNSDFSDPLEDGSTEHPFDAIQEAIGVSDNCDTVIVLSGIYTGTGNRDINYAGRAITVRSSDPNDSAVVAATVINCQGCASEPHRGFDFYNAEGPDSILDGLTIKNGYGPSMELGSFGWRSVGGAIRCYDTSPTIRRCRIENNVVGGYGGGLFCVGGYCNTIIEHCIITSNSSNNAGGGIMCWYGEEVIRHCVIVGNTSGEYGGGLHTYRNPCHVTLSNSILWDNYSLLDELQIGVTSTVYPSELTVSYCDIQGGQAEVFVQSGCTLNWGPGNIDAEPYFADTGNGDYHLKSQAGRWDPLSSNWVEDTVTSPCVDAGDPCSDIGDEPEKNGGRINMGAYGGTIQASKSLGYYIWHVDTVSGDDNNNGFSRDTAFATIQKGINTAENSDVVMVWPGVYLENLDFAGKAITLRSAADAAVLQSPNGGVAVLFHSNEDANSVLKNFVIQNSYTGIFIIASEPTIEYITLVNNETGITGFDMPQSHISNCIFWNNSYADLIDCEAAYSCVQDGDPGPGNISIDPMFADPCAGDYHLVSELGRFVPVDSGQFGNRDGVWVRDDNTSPCVDTGDPGVNPSGELMPNGGRVNVGAYGGTPYASQSAWPLKADINYDGTVNLVDFAALSEEWLLGLPWAQ